MRRIIIKGLSKNFRPYPGSQGKLFKKPRRRQRREGSIEESCRVYAQERGWDSRKMNGLGFRDWPDRLFIQPRVPIKKLRMGGKDSAGRRIASLQPHQVWNGRFWVEFKKPGQGPTPSQAIKIADLRARGEEVFVLCYRADFIKVLDARTNR